MKDFLSKLAPYSKAIIAAGGAVVVVGEALSDGDVSQAEMGLIATSILAVYGVYKKRNAPLPSDKAPDSSNNRL